MVGIISRNTRGILLVSFRYAETDEANQVRILEDYKMENSFNDLKMQLTETDIDAIIAIIGKGCRDKTKNRLRSILTYAKSTIPAYGIFSRLYRDESGSWDYCAGQSYTDEIRTLRECILNG